MAGLNASAQGETTAQVNALKQQYRQKAAMRRANGEEMPKASLVVVCKSDASPADVGERLKALGAEVNSIYGRCVAVTIPVDQIDAMVSTDGVLLVDVAAKSTRKTDTTRKVTHTDEVLTGTGEQLTQAYTGKGVVIGVIDGGFDFTHPGFKDKEGNLRIKSVYAGGYKGLSPEELVIRKKDDKGVETEVKLLPGIVTDPGVILDTLKLKDTIGNHGSHCAYIAGGTPIEGINGLTDKPLGGMAPDAEFVFCLDGPVSNTGYVEDLDNVDSNYLDYMRWYAEKNDKELVVSLSSNSHEGWHNGTSPSAQMYGAFAKNNVLMLCTSNEGGNDMYIHRTVNVGDSVNVALAGNQYALYYYAKSVKPIRVRVGFFDINTLEELYSYPVTINTGVKAVDTLEINPVIDEEANKSLTPAQIKELEDRTAEVCKYIEQQGNILVTSSQGKAMESPNSDKTFNYTSFIIRSRVMFKRKDDKPLYGLTLHITPLEEAVEIHGWNDSVELIEKKDVYEIGTGDCSVGDYNTSGLPVSVGAWTANNKTKKPDGTVTTEDDLKVGDIAGFSSYGTDLAGHKHPDVCTPGVAVYAAVNSFVTDADEKDHIVAQADFKGQFVNQQSPRTYKWFAYGGTSMSTPASAGIVALWLQAARDKGKKLTSADIKDICAKTSDTDDFTKAKPERFGAGKMNAYKGLLYVLGLYDPAGINAISTHQPADVSFRLVGDCLYADGAADGTPATLYNLQGVVVGQTTVQRGIISLAGLQKGVYAVQIAKLGSTLIRK